MFSRIVKAGSMSRRRRTAAFVRDCRGAAALEFAIVALPFLAIVFCILEVAVDYLIANQVDRAIQAAVTDVRSGNVQLQQISKEEFRTNVVCPRLTGLTCSKVWVRVVTISIYTDYYNKWLTQTFDTGGEKWCPGGPGDALLVQIAYPVPLASLIWAGTAIAESGSRYYLSSSGLRNDPNGTAFTNPAGC